MSAYFSIIILLFVVGRRTVVCYLIVEPIPLLFHAVRSSKYAYRVNYNNIKKDFVLIYALENILCFALQRRKPERARQVMHSASTSCKIFTYAHHYAKV